MVGNEGARAHLEHDATDAPHVHFVIIKSVGEQALGRSVPSRRDVFGVRLLRVDAAARAEVGKLESLVGDKDVLWLDVPVEDTVAVHVVHALKQLMHVKFDATLGEIMPTAADELIDVHLHQLEDQSEPPCRLVVQHLGQLDHSRVWRESAQRLDLPQVIHLIERIEVVLHALDRHIFAAFYALCLEHLGKGPLALLPDQAILCWASVTCFARAQVRSVRGGGRARTTRE